MNKHPDDYVFGLDKDTQDKMRAKFDPDKQATAQAWIEEVLGLNFDDDFQPSLKNGIFLCMLVNKIKPDSVKKINKGKKGKPANSFKQRENIVNYLNACKAFGMPDVDCFVTKDLFEGDNMVAVIDQIHALGGLSRKQKAFDGPYIGVTVSEENKRVFTEEQLTAGRKIVPLQNAGSIAVEKESGTDHIVLYGKAGTDLGKASSEVSQQNAGSIAVEKSKGTDTIVRYGKVGQQMGKASSDPSQQNAGSIAVEKERGTDHIVRYGKVGQEMGKSLGGISQQNAGSIAVEKSKGTDQIVKYGKVGQDMGKSVGGTSQQNAGSIVVGKEKKLDSISRALN